MAIKMVREPSETPNINNIDDIIPMRYAYGGQNGFVIGKGTEISNTVSGLNFTVNSGRLVLQGVECDIDATGVTITIDNIATKRYYTVYLEVNLGLNTATIKSEYDTATYPSIDAGDDLTENTTGVARLPLYQFTATSGIIGEVNKVVESVKYTANMTVDNSKKVNNLEIKQDENGILKIEDIIIPQRKLIKEVNIVTRPTQGRIPLNVGNLTGKTIEILYSTGSSEEAIVYNEDVIKLVIRPDVNNFATNIPITVHQIDTLDSEYGLVVLQLSKSSSNNDMMCSVYVIDLTKGTTTIVDYPVKITKIYEIIE